jgi:hypothetical protein
MSPYLDGIAYLSGAIHDGCLVKRKTTTRYDIQFYQKNRTWLRESILERLNKLGIDTPIRGPWKNCYFLKFGCKWLYKELDNRMNKLPKDKDMQIEFIRGFWDAEGSCPHVEKYLNGERKRGKIPPQIGFHQNGTKELLNEIRETLISYGTNCSKLEGPILRPVNKKPEYRFFIYSVKRIKYFFNLVQPEHPDKRKRLILMFGNVNPSNRKL